jgi:dienelactone hydrolase
MIQSAFARVLLGSIFLVCLQPLCRAQEPSPERCRADFLKIINVQKAPLDAKEDAPRSEGALSRIHFSFAAGADQRVPGILTKLSDAQGRRPVIIFLHGTGGRKEDFLSTMARFAKKGFIAVAIDAPYHGERCKEGKGDHTYNAAIARAFIADEHGRPSDHPLYYQTVWDVMRLEDYLDTRDDVDPHRIGLMGISKGGIETYLSAALEPRIAVAVPCIGVQNFEWALDNDAWRPRIATFGAGFAAAMKEAGVQKPDVANVRQFYDRVIPGINGEFNGPAMLTLIAPRPLLVINGDHDDKTPLTSVRLCARTATQAYAKDNASDHFKLIIEPKTGHAVTASSMDAIEAWFTQWLKP